MEYYSLPVAQRTRSKEEENYMEIFARKKKMADRKITDRNATKTKTKNRRDFKRNEDFSCSFDDDGDDSDCVMLKNSSNGGERDVLAKKKDSRKRKIASSGSDSDSGGFTVIESSDEVGKAFSNGGERGVTEKKKKKQQRKRKRASSGSDSDYDGFTVIDSFDEVRKASSNGGQRGVTEKKKKKKQRKMKRDSDDDCAILESFEEEGKASSNGGKRDVSLNRKFHISDYYNNVRVAEKTMTKKVEEKEKEASVSLSDLNKKKKKRGSENEKTELKNKKKRRIDTDDEEEERNTALKVRSRRTFHATPEIEKAAPKNKPANLNLERASDSDDTLSDFPDIDDDDDNDGIEIVDSAVKIGCGVSGEKRGSKKAVEDEHEEEKEKKKQKNVGVAVSESLSGSDDSDTDSDDDDDDDVEDDDEEEDDDDGDEEDDDDQVKVPEKTAIKTRSRSNNAAPASKTVAPNKTGKNSEAKLTRSPTPTAENISVTKEEEEEEPKKKKKKKSYVNEKARKKLDILKNTLSSMLENSAESFADSLHQMEAEEKKKKKKDEDGDGEPEFLLKFFWNPKPKQQLKPHEIEEEYLWSVFHGSLDSDEASNKVADSSDDDYGDENLDQDALCALGKHQLFFNDQEEICCRNCLQPIVESRFVYAEFGKNQTGRNRYRDLGYRRRSPFLEEFNIPDHRSSAETTQFLSDAEIREHAETAWDLIPGVREKMYPHQREGFEFVWNRIAGGIDRDSFESAKSKNGGGGCIISHAPGTGKSRLTIAVLQSLLRLNPLGALPVIVAPKGMLLTWEEEFKKWRFNAPFYNMCVESRGVDRKSAQMERLCRWKRGGAVLGVSYQTFEKLITGSTTNIDDDDDNDDDDDDDDDEDANGCGRLVKKVLIESPGFVVLDEGHIPRNKNSLIWKALKRVQTRRRVILTGTPFQNNLYELYNTMVVINPMMKETRKEWKSLVKSFDDNKNRSGGSGSSSIALSRIKAIITPYIHIHRGDVLERCLPGIKESVVVLRPTDRQAQLIRLAREAKIKPIHKEQKMALISIHPCLNSVAAGTSYGRDWMKKSSDHGDYKKGVKTRFTIELIRRITTSGERVLVFCQYLDPLKLVTAHLRKEFRWEKGTEILYIDGDRNVKDRQVSINRFNDPKGPARVMLVSTKAGGEGINLVGASRVVMLDTVWNPAVERQATRRAYRLGQKKYVYVYHLVAADTTEEDKYRRQTAKSKISELVFSGGGGDDDGGNKYVDVNEDAVLEEMMMNENLKEIFVKIGDKRDDWSNDL